MYFLYKQNKTQQGGLTPQEVSIGLGNYNQYYVGECTTAEELYSIQEYSPVVISTNVAKGMSLIGLTEIVNNMENEETLRALTPEELANQELATKFIQKIEKRNIIKAEVFDIEDSVSDNAKMISLIMSTMSKIYSSLPEEQKETIESQERSLIEYTFSEFLNCTTNADSLLQDNGTVFIDTLLDRQSKINNILN